MAQADDLLDQVRHLQAHALDILERAEKAGDLRTALAAISQARGNLELLGKLAGELDERPVVNLNVSPEWLELKSGDSRGPGASPSCAHSRSEGAWRVRVMVSLAEDLKLALDRVRSPGHWDSNPMGGKRSCCAPHRIGCSSTVAASRASSTISGVIALHRALYYPGSLVLCLAPALRQTQELFGKVLGFYRDLGRPVSPQGERKLSLELENGSPDSDAARLGEDHQRFQRYVAAGPR